MIPRTQTLKVEDFPDQADWIEPLLRAVNTGATQTSQALSSQLTFGENLNATLKTVEVTLNPDWIVATMENAWTTAGEALPAEYRKVGDKVEMRGSVTGGVLATTAFTLPVGMRPSRAVALPTLANGAFGYLSVTEAGAVVPQAGSATAFWVGGDFAVDGPTTPNGAFPLKFAHGLSNGAKAVGCWVVGVSDVTGSARNPLSGAGFCAWRPNGSEVIVDDVPGLYPGRKYQVTFLVSGG